jgi:hypothetical protein
MEKILDLVKLFAGNLKAESFKNDIARCFVKTGMVPMSEGSNAASAAKSFAKYEEKLVTGTITIMPNGTLNEDVVAIDHDFIANEF